jgi:cystathionine beta-synthase
MACVLDLIGSTPLIEVTRIDRAACRLFLKLESANPSGSIKDRPARTMIEAAETEGRADAKGIVRCLWCPIRWRARRCCTPGPWARKS